ncbi:hypothetical protein JMUB6875_12360 [Nocardia sp. JMUB6875]|uniref:hypothetical protein n=1 Tax=Nocardia sp. JMUB6875 TaxID=3158170 RepID=UPI0032E58B81
MAYIATVLGYLIIFALTPACWLILRSVGKGAIQIDIEPISPPHKQDSTNKTGA